MANTWNGTDLANIANTALEVFVKRLANIRIFTTDFSAESFNGTSVSTRIVPAGNAPAAKSTTSYVALAGDTTTTNVTVNLNQHKVNGYTITLKEAASMGAGVLSDLEMRLIRQNANKMADDVLAYAFALITAGNFANAHSAVAAAAFDYEDVIDFRTTLAAANYPIMDTVMCLSSGHLGALMKDQPISAQYSSGLSTIVDGAGAIMRLGGMQVMEAVTLPTTGNLAGFTCTPSAIAIAMRPPNPANADLPPGVTIDTIADPATGLSLSVYRHFDNTQKQWVTNFEAWYGASVGVAAHLYRIVSAV